MFGLRAMLSPHAIPQNFGNFQRIFNLSQNSTKHKLYKCLFQYREERFRQTSESTNSRVLWWSLGQTGILLVMGAWQMRHLKSFFEAKKLV